MKFLLSFAIGVFICFRCVAAQELVLECKLKGVHPKVLSMDFSPDDKTLVVGGRNGAIMLFDIASRELIAKKVLKGEFIYQASFSPDGKSIAAAAEDKIVFWDSKLNDELRRFPQPKVTCFCFDPSSKSILIGRSNAALDIFDVEQQETVKTLMKEAPTRSIAWSPDGKLIACGKGGDHIEVFDATTYRQLHQLARYRKYFPPVAFSPDSSLLAIGCNEGEVLLWNPNEGKEHSRLMVPSSGALGEGDPPIANIICCSNGKLLAVTDYEKTRVWNWVAQSVIATFHKKIDPEKITDQSMAFSHNGKSFALFDRNEISIWKLP